MMKSLFRPAWRGLGHAGRRLRPCMAALAGVAAAAAAGLPLGAAAADWKPDHPVTMVVPYAAGGGTDAQARVVAKELSQLWGQPVVVENLDEHGGHATPAAGRDAAGISN
ncbi:hypothetical protein H4CHR_01739 [Variovorax sp. PBS-H4]|uniref:hypothetical protein n=1 Tax=Variovorax sp. PBS-H4 TaxID=434008 RepID=UPI0013164175|nr:hypothetical protein [Variovorax sp. PBS-H4]VTU26156.1 hypothetical protein H4CHR_01739 [Variovorax sp. PBS-H4]